MSDASLEFDRALRALIVPVLAERAFGFDCSRTFRRTLQGGFSVQIVNFQLGARSLAGKFTVNLAVYEPGDASDIPGLDIREVREYHCPNRRQERLGKLMQPLLAPLQSLSAVGFLFGPKDRWWSFSADKSHTKSQLQEACQAVFLYGFPWLERASSSTR